MTKRFATLLISTLAILLGACSTVKVTSWMDPQFKGRTLGKTMVLGIGESDSLSRQYEGLFVERLSELGSPSTSYHAHTGSTGQIAEEDLVRELLLNGYTSILVTRLLDETERQQVVNTGYYPEHYGNYWGYYSYGYTLTYNTAYVQSFTEYELETNLYDIETKKLVWSGRKVIYDDRSDLSNMKDVIRSTIKDLGKKDLL